MSKTYHSQFFVQINANRSDPVKNFHPSLTVSEVPRKKSCQKTYHSRFFVQIDADRSVPINCYSDEHDENLHSGHPVGKKWPVIYQISALA